jgi:hypothetical protein
MQEYWSRRLRRAIGNAFRGTVHLLYAGIFFGSFPFLRNRFGILPSCQFSWRDTIDTVSTQCALTQALAPWDSVETPVASPLYVCETPR